MGGSLRMCRQADKESSSAAFSSKLRGYEQKPDTRPVWTGEWAKLHEARPKSLTPCSSALVNRELVQRKSFVLSREIRSTYLSPRLA